MTKVSKHISSRAFQRTTANDRRHGYDLGASFANRGADAGYCKDRTDAYERIAWTDHNAVSFQDRGNDARRRLRGIDVIEPNFTHARLASAFYKVLLEVQLSFIRDHTSRRVGVGHRK